MKNFLPSQLVKNGAKKTRIDHRDYSFPKMFGSTTAFVRELNLDVGMTNRNQDADGYPNGCTGYTQSDLCVDEDKRIYNPIFTYKKTLVMEGKSPDSNKGAYIRDSLRSTIKYGVLPTAGNEPYKYRRSAFANVQDITNLDAFDDLRSTLQISKHSISIGTPWFQLWSATNNSGIIQEIDFTKYTRKQLLSSRLSLKVRLPWHNYKICGWKVIKGKTYLIAKPWIGASWGDKGFCYFSKETINGVMRINGTNAFTLIPFPPAINKGIQVISLSLWDKIISFIIQIIKYI